VERRGEERKDGCCWWIYHMCRVTGKRCRYTLHPRETPHASCFSSVLFVCRHDHASQLHYLIP